MTESSQINKLATTARRLGQLFEKAGHRRKNIERTMRKLKAQGLIYATTHMRDQKYMYLLYPSKAGEPRRREYVGSNLKRMAEANEGIQRRESYDAALAQLQSLDLAIYKASMKLSEAVAELGDL